MSYAMGADSAGSGAAAGAAGRTGMPRIKVVAAAGGSGVASALAVIVIWAIRNAGIALPEEIAGAISTIMIAVITFLAGYYVPPGASEATMLDANNRAVSASVST